jgi:transposase
MTKLEDVSADHLRELLANAESAKAAKRLMVALAYKNSVSVNELTERYGFAQSTIYYWLDRLDTEQIEDALRDAPKPGRPPKLSEAEREQAAAWLEKSPETFGYDAESWTAALLRDRIAEEFGVDYSTAHVGRTFLD